MSKVRVHDGGNMAWHAVRTMTPANAVHLFSDTELDSRLRVHEPGTDGALQLLEVNYLPDASIDLHAYDEEEIIYVVSGAMHIGARVLEPGSSIYIQADTLYGFKAGPQGLRMLNFRPKGGQSFHSRDEFLARRAAGAQADA